MKLSCKFHYDRAVNIEVFKETIAHSFEQGWP